MIREICSFQCEAGYTGFSSGREFFVIGQLASVKTFIGTAYRISRLVRLSVILCFYSVTVYDNGNNWFIPVLLDLAVQNLNCNLRFLSA